MSITGLKIILIAVNNNILKWGSDMRFKDFPLDKFLINKEKMDKNLLSFLQTKDWIIPVVQEPIAKSWGNACKYNDKSLEVQLDYLYDTTVLQSDLNFSYLEPWLGVGVYASAFGCKYEWVNDEPPQTRPIFTSVDDLIGLKYPNLNDCEVMQMILDRIKFFKQKTGGLLDISVTDTQSPNDTASLIMETTEFFIASIAEPEILDPFLTMITKSIIEFTEMQIESIGECLTRPGHVMLSHKSLKGIAISDDNMALISPESYRNISLPYNNMLSRHFGGISIHSCGNHGHNGHLLHETDNLLMVDCPTGKRNDPTPNKAGDLKKNFLNTGVVLKTKIGFDEIDKIEELIDPGIKLIVQVWSGPEYSIDERNRQFEAVKERVHHLQERKLKGTGA